MTCVRYPTPPLSSLALGPPAHIPSFTHPHHLTPHHPCWHAPPASPRTWKTYQVGKGPHFALERKKQATDLTADMLAK